MHGRKHFPNRGLAKTQVIAKTRGCAKTPPLDRSAKTHLGARKHFPKTSRVKTRVVAKTCGRAKTPRDDKSGEHTHRREDTWATHRSGDSRQPQKAVCFELQGRSFCCSKLYASTCKVLLTMAQLHDLIISRCVHTRPRLKALAGFSPRARAHARTHRVHSGFGNALLQIQHLHGVAPNVALLAHVWRRLPMWRQEAMWCCRMWCQNVASLAHLASGGQFASPDVASTRGVICAPGVRQPVGVARCGAKAWRHLPT